MNGWKMVAARRAMARMIDTLSEADRFAVFAFDDRIETPKWAAETHVSQLIPATDRNRFQAVEFLAKLESRGGTEIAQPLDQAVGLLAEPHDRDHDRDRILVLVTDGQVGNEDQVLKMLGSASRESVSSRWGSTRRSTKGSCIGWPSWGRAVARASWSSRRDRLDAVMDSIHRRIGTPVVTDVRLEPARRLGSSSSPMRWCPIGRRVCSRARRSC